MAQINNEESSRSTPDLISIALIVQDSELISIFSKNSAMIGLLYPVALRIFSTDLDLKFGIKNFYPCPQKLEELLNEGDLDIYGK